MPSPITAKKATPKKAPAKAPVLARTPAPRKAKAKKVRIVSTWEPRAIPVRPTGRPADPRLAAALAARERWHGRSGRPALKSATQAVAFARERRLVHLTVPSALPNMIDPVVGRACSPQERGSGIPGTTLGAWSREVLAANDLLDVRLCFEQPTLVQAELWPSVATIAAPLEEQARGGGVLSQEAEEALELLDRKGIMPVERLRNVLGLTTKDFARIQGELEAHLLVLSRGDVDDDDVPIHVLEPLGRWAARAVTPRRPDLHQAWTLLFGATVRAAVVLWPSEEEAIFPWTAEQREQAVAAALQTGAVVTYVEGDTLAYVASPVPR